VSPRRNEAWLGDRWASIDATWDAGYVRDSRFHKDYSTKYFLPADSVFALDHSSIRTSCPPAMAIEVAASAKNGAHTDYVEFLRDDWGCSTTLVVHAPPAFLLIPSSQIHAVE
jgi:hypothetical protein